MLPNFKTYYKSVVLKMVWHWNKYRHTDQQNRIQSPEVDPQIYGQLIFSKGVKVIQ